jgi:hypothetical protein
VQPNATSDAAASQLSNVADFNPATSEWEAEPESADAIFAGVGASLRERR